MPITAAQQERRKSHLGSSDMAAILGLDKFRGPYDVWLEKTGRLNELEANEAMIIGTFLENGVLDHAETTLGKLIRNQYRSAKDKGLPLAANVDAIVVETGNPVEAKTAGIRSITQEYWGQDGTDETPDRVVIQTHVHMICTDKQLCHVPALIGGRGFAMFTVNRDETIIDVISQTARDFWEKFVVTDTPPDNTLPKAESIKRVKREPQTVVTLADELVKAWLEAKDRVKAASLEKDEIEIKMLTALGDAEGGQTSSGMLTYLEQGRDTVDQKALKAAYPDIYERFTRRSAFRVARFKKA